MDCETVIMMRHIEFLNEKAQTLDPKGLFRNWVLVIYGE